MTKVHLRCTQCSTENEVELPAEELDHGGGKAFGTEVAPCEACGEETVQNRRAPSAPNPKR